MSTLESALAELRSAATTSTLPHLPTPQSAALLDHIDRLTADLAEAREQVQAACCGPWHERETTEADAAAFPWGRVKAAREVAARWHAHAHWQASQGPREATVAWAVAQTLLSLVLDELDYDGIEPRNERAAEASAGFEYGFENMDRGGEGPMMVGRSLADIREQMALRRATFPEVHYALRRRPVGPWETVEESDPSALVPGRQDTAAETRTCTGCDGTGERRDFNADGEFESVERCGGCDGTGRVAIAAEDSDDDAPTCRDCGTWPCARHATEADRAEYEQATESGSAR